LKSPAFLGKFIAYLAEADPGTPDADLLRLAQQFAGSCLPQGERHGFSLPIGALVVAPLGESAQAAFVYRRG
jgi:hypothetical protein